MKLYDPICLVGREVGGMHRSNVDNNSQPVIHRRVFRYTIITYLLDLNNLYFK